MPEGHSIRKLADQWGTLKGQKFTVSSPQGRFQDEAKALSGGKLIDTHAHGKHLFLEFENKQYVHVHLGLYGRFVWYDTNKPPEPRATIRMRAISKNKSVDLSGPTKCELLDEAGKNLIHARLGPDPLHPEDTVEPILDWASKAKIPIGRTLMDQKRIAGIGNVYRAEILFMLAIDPHRETSSITKEEWNKIWDLSRTLLKAGVKHHGGITTTLPGLPEPVTLPKNTHCASRTYVYKRTGKPCVACNTPIEQEQMDSRTLYYCPSCQS